MHAPRGSRYRTGLPKGGGIEAALAGELLDRTDIMSDRLVHRDIGFAPGGILVSAAVEIFAGPQVGFQTADMGIGKRHGHSLAVVGRRDTHMDKNIFDSAQLFM